MAASVQYQKHTGPMQGTWPISSGTTITFNMTNMDFLSSDSTDSYTAAPITGGNRSYVNQFAAVFSGTYNTIESVTWRHATGGLDSPNITLYGNVWSGYASPGTGLPNSVSGDLEDWTAIMSVGSGVLLGGSGAGYQDKTASATVNPAYSQYLVTQLRTTTSASAGDVSSGIGLTLSYTES